MSKRKNLDDVIYGDRAVVRGYKTFGGRLDYDWNDRKTWATTTTTGIKKCYESHPALKLPGTELVIYGGSCCDPIVKDADVYIGFDVGMRFTERHWPWKKGNEVLFKITDMCAPSKPDEFKKLVDWTLKQLEAGRKVHCGCIGGHGRTGTFLAALVSVMGEKDAIAYVRKHYCHKTVESSAQIDFLVKHFGVKPAKATRAYTSESSSSKSYYGGSSSASKSTSSKLAASNVKVFDPIPYGTSIWGT